MSTGGRGRPDDGWPRCPDPCGKIRFGRAEAHRAARRLRKGGTGLVIAYPQHGAWHVGHPNQQTSRQARRQRAQRRERLDRLDDIV